MIFIYCCNITQSIFTALKTLSALPTDLPSATLAAIYLLNVSVVSFFPECQAVGIIQHLYSLSAWLISLSYVHLSFIHIFSWLDSSFLCTSEHYSSVWIYHSLLILSPTKRHVGCFQVLAIMNKAATKILLQVFFSFFFF